MKHIVKKTMYALIACMGIASCVCTSDLPLVRVQKVDVVDAVVVSQNMKHIQGSCKQLLDGIWYYQFSPSYFSTASKMFGYSTHEIKALELSQSLYGMRVDQLTTLVDYKKINAIWFDINKNSSVVDLKDLRAKTLHYTCSQLGLDAHASYEDNKPKIEAAKKNDIYQSIYANCTALSSLYENGLIKK